MRKPSNLLVDNDFSEVLEDEEEPEEGSVYDMWDFEIPEIPKDVKDLVGDLVLKALSGVIWQHREDDVREDPVVVNQVEVATEDEEEWGLLVTVLCPYTNTQTQTILLSEFLTYYEPTGPITFRRFDA